jgi:hypothetical protein
MKAPMISLLALATTGALATLSAQYDVPQSTPPIAEQAPIVNTEAPVASLDSQLGTAVFDQRGAFASAFDEANRLVDVQVARLRSRGLIFGEEASTNLTSAREEARQAFRDLSLTTEETWPTARHNAVSSLRKIQDALVNLEKTATRPR